MWKQGRDLTGIFRGILMEIAKHASASQKVKWAIFWKYKYNEVLISDWRKILRVLVVLWFFFLQVEQGSKLGWIRI